MDRLCEGRVAIVTGAGRGLGREHALMLAAHGAKIIVNDIGTSREGSGKDPSPASQVVDEIRKAGGEAETNGDDVADWDGAKLGQRFTDTLCGTKVLRRSDYLRLKAGRSYFGDFDPFGDFDLIFGASKLSLKIVEVPVRYASRTYGETQISRFRHGLMLLRMMWFAFLRIKAL